MADLAREAEAVLAMLGRERLIIDGFEPQRTSFLTHVGSNPKLVPGAWIAHREWILAMALANLSQPQRASLARSISCEHGREFGVGHLLSTAISSGLPCGGSSLRIAHRNGGPSCLYVHALAPSADATPVDWLLLRAEQSWCAPEPPPALTARGMATWVALGGSVLISVESALEARLVAEELGSIIPAAHPRFSPHLLATDPSAPVLLWPHDAFESPALEGREIRTLLLIDAPEPVRAAAQKWRERRPQRVDSIESVCPGRMDPGQLRAYWETCGRPAVMLRGDPVWAREGTGFLAGLGAGVVTHPKSAQLGLF